MKSFYITVEYVAKQEFFVIAENEEEAGKRVEDGSAAGGDIDIDYKSGEIISIEWGE